ncbi:MAG: response regulator, partial [Nitrososphaeraceae archaeon]|nr:response regulator [Nitrososphaeraceae archaeon]
MEYSSWQYSGIWSCHTNCHVGLRKYDCKKSDFRPVYIYARRSVANRSNQNRNALSNFKPDYYDLIILDIKMPGMDGFE